MYLFRHHLILLLFVLLAAVPAKSQTSYNYIFIEMPGLDQVRDAGELNHSLHTIPEIQEITYCDKLHLVILAYSGSKEIAVLRIQKGMKRLRHRYIIKSDALPQQVLSACE